MLLLASGCDLLLEPDPEAIPEPGVTAMIGAEGGVLRSEDGVLTLSFGAGSLGEEYEFRIVETLDAPPSIGLAYHVEPAVELLAPISVTFAFTPGEVEGRDLATLRLARDLGDLWDPLPVELLDEEAGTVSARDDAVSFSYGLIEQLEPASAAMGDDAQNDDDDDDDDDDE